MTRRVRDALESPLGLIAVGAAQRYLVHRLVVEVAEADPQQQTWTGAGNEAAMQAVAVTAEGHPGGAVEATGAVFEQLHGRRCDDCAVPHQEVLGLRAGDSLGVEQRLE